MDTTARAAHWEEAALLSDYLIGLTGGPKALALGATLSRRMVFIIRDWLRLLEAFVRRLVLIDALALPRPNLPAPRPPGRSVRVRTSFGRPGYASDDPADWGVSFRMVPAIGGRAHSYTRAHKIKGFSSALALPSTPYRLPGAAPIDWAAYAHLLPQHSAHGAARPRTPSALRSPLPLAERLEAILRVMAAPEPYAQRLARRLNDHRAPSLIERMLIPLPRSPADPDGVFLDHLQNRCLKALNQAVCDTS